MVWFGGRPRRGGLPQHPLAPDGNPMVVWCVWVGVCVCVGVCVGCVCVVFLWCGACVVVSPLPAKTKLTVFRCSRFRPHSPAPPAPAPVPPPPSAPVAASASAAPAAAASASLALFLLVFQGLIYDLFLHIYTY